MTEVNEMITQTYEKIVSLSDDTLIRYRDRFYPGWWSYPRKCNEKSLQPFYLVLCNNEQECELARNSKPSFIRAEIVHKDNWKYLLAAQAGEDSEELSCGSNLSARTGIRLLARNFLTQVQTKIHNGKVLTYGDVGKITTLIELTVNTDTETFSRVISVLSEDLKFREKLGPIDCLEDSHLQKRLFGAKPRDERSSLDSMRSTAVERVRVILNHEYRRLHREAATKFIEGKIDYSDYLERTEKFARDAARLYPR